MCEMSHGYCHKLSMTLTHPFGKFQGTFRFGKDFGLRGGENML